MGISVIHSFFEAYHASGIQDSVGKDPRIAMARQIGFKSISLYSYHDCYVSPPLKSTARSSQVTVQ